MDERSLSMLVGSDLHHSQDGCEWFYALAEQRKPELIVFLGDFVNRGPITFIREVLLVLRSLAPACFVIPGNWDPRDALLEFDAAAFDGLRNLHRAAAWLHGYSFAGLGGSTTTPVGDTPLESSAADFVAPLAPLLPADIWLLHNPVYGHCDLAGGTQHVGSRELASLLAQQEPPPFLVLSGHIHEALGVEQASATLYANPGALAAKRAASVTLTGSSASVELLGG